MSQSTDRLNDLLPVIYRMRDAELGWPLRGLLGVVSEQVNLVEADIAQLYENWFIETCQDWAVPYIGDLIGYEVVHEAGEPGEVTSAEGAARNQAIIPRRDVADTIRNRRRKGTLALLEELAMDVSGWPSRAVEFFTLLGWTQNLYRTRMTRGRTVDLRNGDALDHINGPFDELAHTVDVRRINSHRSTGRYNIPEVGLFVWRLKVYPVSRMSAHSVEERGPQFYTFNRLGIDTQLYVSPQAEESPTHIAEELNLPVPIRRHAVDKHIHDYYGVGRSFGIWAEWSDFNHNQLIPADRILAADLSDWSAYLPPRDMILVDPELGRIVFPANQLPRRVRVAYHYAFSADIGGGEYRRRLSQPAETTLIQVHGQDQLKAALVPWQEEKQLAHQPVSAVIEIADSGIYVLPIHIHLKENHDLQIRASNAARPVIRLLDWQNDSPDALTVTLSNGSRFTLDGLMITGRPVHIRGNKMARVSGSDCLAELNIRHCTLVPGWSLDADCEPRRSTEPSLVLFEVRAQVAIEHSILGSIQVNENPVLTDPIPVKISDSILDATGPEREALGAPGYQVAHAIATFQRVTVFGIVSVHAMKLAENSIFNNCVNVARRQIGCMRFCAVPEGCRTPRRYHCQPEQAERDAQDVARQELLAANNAATPAQIQAVQNEARIRAHERVRPLFTHRRYGRPGYAQLALDCADEIKRGADDGSEMGVFHDLFQPQREANLRIRLAEFTPAGMDVNILFAS